MKTETKTYRLTRHMTLTGKGRRWADEQKLKRLSRQHGDGASLDALYPALTRLLAEEKGDRDE